jgi:hypothetical protein
VSESVCVSVWPSVKDRRSARVGRVGVVVSQPFMAQLRRRSMTRKRPLMKGWGKQWGVLKCFRAQPEGGEERRRWGGQ